MWKPFLKRKDRHCPHFGSSTSMSWVPPVSQASASLGTEPRRDPALGPSVCTQGRGHSNQEARGRVPFSQAGQGLLVEKVTLERRPGGGEGGCPLGI